MSRLRPSRICVRTAAGVLFALAQGGLWAAGQSPALPAPYETYGGSAWTVADFDGDGRPDVLTARPELAGAGFRHRIEIQLSSGAGRVVSFAIDGLQPGLQVAALDVNGDHDIDLVFTTAVSHQTVGIWINNGAGAFARGADRDCGTPFAQITRSGGLTSSDLPGRFSYIPRPRWQPLSLASARCETRPPPGCECYGGLLQIFAVSAARGLPLTRAPPALL